jgi:predicted TIM-barrel fold metal-dependent hydrolase
MAATGLYDDGLNRPTNPQLRCLDQDQDGVAAEVIYGIFNMGAKLNDPVLAAAVYVAFNDFFAEFCSYAPERYIGLGCLPVHDAGAAAAELNRCVGLGFRGVVMDIKNGCAPLYHEAWDPVWGAASDSHIPVSFHLGGKSSTAPSALGTMRAMEGDALREAALGMSMLQFTGAADYFGLIFGGALDRFPTLDIVLAESGIGWIPSMLERLDYEIDNEFEGLGLELKPSEYWQRQMFATFSNDEAGLSLLGRLGEDRVMFASDYPHPDGIWPDSRRYIEEGTRFLSAAARQKVTWQNAARLYKVDAPRAASPT